MGIFNNFLWKSPADQMREQEEYRRWAFPYGDKQQESLKSLLADVFPKYDRFVMFTFLTIKEMYDKAIADHESHDAALEALADDRRRTKLQAIKQVKKDDWYKYLAIVVADKNIDIECKYPLAEEIFESARKLSEMAN